MDAVVADDMNRFLVARYESISIEIDSVTLNACKQFDDIGPDPSVAWFMDITFHPTIVVNDESSIIDSVESRDISQVPDYSAEISLLLESIETLFEYIKLFRGSLALYKTNRYSEQIRTIFNADLSRVSRSRIMKNALINWIVWMNLYCNSEDRVLRECIDYMKALCVILDVDKTKKE